MKYAFKRYLNVHVALMMWVFRVLELKKLNKKETTKLMSSFNLVSVLNFNFTTVFLKQDTGFQFHSELDIQVQ